MRPDVVDCIVALPGQLFYSTQIPACLWFLARRQIERRCTQCQAARPPRRGAIHRCTQDSARMVDRTRKEFSADADIGRIAGVISRLAGRSRTQASYADVPGFCKAATLEEVRVPRAMC